MPILSVIMPVYNESFKELNASITSILNQTYKNFELIIIDDNPRSKNIKNFLTSKSLSDKRIKLIFNKKQLGPSLSRNKGIRISQGKLIAIMDADDVSVKNRFYYQINFLKKYHLDFVFSNCKFFNYNFSHALSMCMSYNKKIINQNILKYIFSHYCDCAVHSGWLLRKTIYSNLNGYRHLKHGEDYDFIIRSLSKGYKLGYQPQVLIYKRGRETGVSNSNQLMQFKISLILKKYVKRNNYKEIIPINIIYRLQNNINNKENYNFSQFLKSIQSVKNHCDFKTLYQFTHCLFKSVSAMKYIFEHIHNNICKRIILYKLR